MTARPLDVLTLADEAFAVPLAVLGRSIADHLSPGCFVRLTVLDGGLSPASIALCRESWGERIRPEFVRPSRAPWPRLVSRGRIPLLTFERLRVGSLLPRDRERALILDADQLVRADIAPLFDVPFDGAVALAPADAFIPTLGSPLGLERPERWRLRSDQPFLCGAVVMLDLPAWRSGGFEEAAVRVVSDHHETLLTYDQDVLNIVLSGCWRALDPRWQHQPRLENLGHSRGPAAEPAVVHFSGRLKPWLYRGRSRWDREFLAALARTAFGDVRPRHSLRSWLWTAYDTPLRRLTYPLEWRIERLFRRVTREQA